MTAGLVVWFTGLPASGKSTLAAAVREKLVERGRCCALLDGDAVRGSLVPSPGYDDQARDQFYETLAGLATLLAQQGLIVLVPATAHLRRFRERARTLAPRFVEVLVEAAQSERLERDPKGLYAAAARGAVTTLPGAGVAYEPPLAPDVVAQGGQDAAALGLILERIG